MKNLPNRTRKNRVEVCFDDEELALIKKKMDKANIKNKSASVTLDPYRDKLFRKLLLNAATFLLYGRALCSIFKKSKKRNVLSGHRPDRTGCEETQTRAFSLI